MPYLTVNLTPTLTGVLGTLSLISGETVYPLIELPPSDNGFISVFVTVTDPTVDFAVIFPQQTLEGVTYAETASTVFTLITNVLVNVTLTPKPVIPIPTVSGLGLLVAIVAGVFIFAKKK